MENFSKDIYKKYVNPFKKDELKGLDKNVFIKVENSNKVFALQIETGIFNFKPFYSFKSVSYYYYSNLIVDFLFHYKISFVTLENQNELVDSIKNLK